MKKKETQRVWAEKARDGAGTDGAPSSRSSLQAQGESELAAEQRQDSGGTSDTPADGDRQNSGRIG